MTIAETIKENSIIEYVFMWQTEDMVRGFRLDLKSKKNISKILMV